VIAETFFVAGVLVMGKPVYKALKAELIRRLTRREDPES
jgi:hypothetical protein